MEYLSKLFSKWMPGQAPVKVDSHPRLSGIMDTINATDAHGPQTKLPREFYDPKARSIIDKIGVEEWYSGYKESTEYRMLGIGALMGDITSRMTARVERDGTYDLLEVGGEDGHLGRGRGGETAIKLAMSGCHDTTLAAVLTSLGAFDGEKWPPFTSHIALELFRQKKLPEPSASIEPAKPVEQRPSWWSALFGNAKKAAGPQGAGIARKPIDQLTDEQKQKLGGYYVRVRYNDKIMQVPGCKPVGKHLDGDESFCTLVRWTLFMTH
jgi:acid phosphatase